MTQRIITAGSSYIDIDTLACASAYKQLLDIRGMDSRVVLTGNLNATVPKSVRSWNISWDNNAPTNPSAYEYVIVDVSEPDHFEKFVTEQNIVEIFDHHFGNEAYWKERLGDNSHIEAVGSCATLIWEAFKKNGKESEISTTNANLLYTAIFANTLNFQASITHDRDRQALQEIEQYTSLNSDWRSTYYTEVESGMFANLAGAIKSDTKRARIGSDDYTIGQMELWHARDLVDRDDFREVSKDGLGIIQSYTEKWMLSVPSIEEGKNYIYTENADVKRALEDTLNADFSSGDIGTTGKLWMRKEIVRDLRKYL